MWKVMKTLRHKSKNALVAGIVDPEALKECIGAEIGENISLNLGGKIDNVFGKPLKINAKVLFISPDSVMNTDRGAVVIETEGVKTVILKTRRSLSPTHTDQIVVLSVNAAVRTANKYINQHY